MPLVTVAALVGGCGNDDKAKQIVAAAHVQATAIVADARKQAQDDVGAARSQINAAQDEAQRNLTDARSNFGSLRRKVSKEQHTLSKLQRQVSGVRQRIAANTFSGTGTYVVGADVAPGEYRAAAQPGCYWARLASLDTSNIIDNDNADGPVAIQIQPSDKAVTVADCADFHKVG
jgi:hypothetical protein